MNFRYDLAQKKREKLKITYADLGAAAGLSSDTVWRVCKGQGDPTATTLTKLFRALGLKPEYALNFQLKKSQFHLAEINGGKAG